MIGQQVSRYKIIEKLGEGGMGEVYLAEDTELHRKVALKFLPAHFSTDPSVHTRFKHEAKAAAALNHSNIITIYDIGEHDGKPFIAMEYLPGKSLKNLLEKEKLSFERIIDLAVQICSGLSEAHHHGITHRDIKPDNILIDAKGRVKIADFGLAKSRGQTKVTDTGSTLGTINYMSPEQLRGSGVDQRADIWSLGVMLYEMITGRLPFSGDYKEAISYSILHDTPEPLARYKTGVSEGWQRIIDKALDKDIETRYQNVSDLLADIKREKKSGSLITPVITEKKRDLKKLFIPALIVFMVILIGIFIINFPSPKSDQPLQTSHKQVSFSGNSFYPSISPDGEFIAYIQDRNKLMLKDLSGGQPIKLFETFFLRYPQWSPDGSELLIAAILGPTGKPEIFIIPRLGGKPRKILPGFVSCWAMNGSWIAIINSDDVSKIQMINKFTMESKTILLGEMPYISGLAWSEQTGQFLFTTANTIWAIGKDEQTPRKLIDDNQIISARWERNGHSVYYTKSTGNTAELVKWTPDSRNESTVITSGLPFGDQFSLTGDNKRLVYSRSIQYTNLWSLEYEGEITKDQSITKKLTRGTSFLDWSKISPDGRWIVYTSGKAPHTNILKMPVNGGEATQLTFGKTLISCPVWSPKGKYIAYISDESGTSQVWTMTNQGEKPRLYKNTHTSFEIVWSPDNKLVYKTVDERNYSILDPDTEEEKPLVQNDSAGFMAHPRFSHDGNKVAVFWNRKDATGLVWIIDLKSNTQKSISNLGLFPMGWSPGEDFIYCVTNDTRSIVKLPVAGGKPTPIFESQGDISSLDVDASGKRFVMSIIENNSDIWSMENFDPEVQ